MHNRGLYLIGRVVVFEDPMLSHGRPDLAVRRSDGSVWEDAAGLGWTNPYDRRVWDYNVDIAEVAAKSGFDEIMFDYVRFPSDGDVESAVYANQRNLERRDAIPSFIRYASQRLEPLGVRVSAAVFGLSAVRDLGIGQTPKRMAPYLHTVYAMTYPSLFGPGELGIADPSAAPGATVARALKRFRAAVRGTDALLVTWVQDWSFSRRSTASTRCAPRSTPHASRARRATCSGTRRACTPTARLTPPQLVAKIALLRREALAPPARPVVRV